MFFRRSISLLFCMLVFIIMPVFAGGYYGAKLCRQSGYSCYRTRRGDSWTKLFPQARDRNVVKRANRMNSRLHAGLVIAVPNNLRGKDHMSISPFPSRTEPQGEKILYIDLKHHAFGAYDANGYLLHWGPVSGGKGWCPDIGRRCYTPKGTFRVYRKGGDGCKSSKYPIGRGGSPMQYCMFFYGHYAMHASYLPGYHASHGCIRMFYEDAKWLNRKFVTLGASGTKVIVY